MHCGPLFYRRLLFFPRITDSGSSTPALGLLPLPRLLLLIPRCVILWRQPPQSCLLMLCGISVRSRTLPGAAFLRLVLRLHCVPPLETLPFLRQTALWSLSCPILLAATLILILIVPIPLILDPEHNRHGPLSLLPIAIPRRRPRRFLFLFRIRSLRLLAGRHTHSVFPTHRFCTRIRLSWTTLYSTRTSITYQSRTGGTTGSMPNHAAASPPPASSVTGTLPPTSNSGARRTAETAHPRRSS